MINLSYCDTPCYANSNVFPSVFFVYHTNSDSKYGKYVLAKVHLYIWGGGGVKAVIRTLEHLWRGVVFFDFPPAIYNFLILPTYQIERICFCT